MKAWELRKALEDLGDDVEVYVEGEELDDDYEIAEVQVYSNGEASIKLGESR